jgi:hypothetical protein
VPLFGGTRATPLEALASDRRLEPLPIHLAPATTQHH